MRNEVNLEGEAGTVRGTTVSLSEWGRRGEGGGRGGGRGEGEEGGEGIPLCHSVVDMCVG